MKKLLLSMVFVAFTGGIASAQVGRCAGNNSPACVNARNAFAEHHGGVYPGQYYQGYRGQWLGSGNNWRWRSEDGREYYHSPRGWEWREAHEHHHHW